MDEKDLHETPIHKAAIDGNLEEARTLVLNGANIEAQCFHLETPLRKAAFNGNLEIVEFLIQKCKRCPSFCFFKIDCRNIVRTQCTRCRS